VTTIYRKFGKSTMDNINGVKPDSTLTGFKDFDERGGFKPGNLIIIAADSSQGKTSLADTIALNVVKSGTPIAFYSLEMTAVQLNDTSSSYRIGRACFRY
jgi:replicative DNA helicase